MSIMAKTPSGYKKIGSAYLGERPVDKVFNANGDVIYALQRELTGVPPLLFKGKEQSELLNYRIYGDTVDGNGVGDLVESGEHAGEYKVPVTIEGKNLLQNTATNQTINGVTFTVNSDGSVTCNGAANNTALFVIHNFPRFSGECILSGCPMNGSQNTYRLQYTNTRDMSYKDYGTGCNIYQFDETQYPLSAISIRIENGYTCNNLTFYPMIRKADIEDDAYEPYHAPVTIPIYLPEPIKMVGDEAEYIDYAEQKLHRVRKNQVVSNVTSRTIDNGDGTFFYITANHDGSVTCSGYAKSTIFISNSYIAELEASTRYILSGCPQGGKYMSYRLDLRFPTGQAIDPIVDYGIGYTFSVDTPGIYVPTVRIAAGYTCDNLTFYPMIRKADIEDDTYEPYIENTDLDVTLPALPTLPGTNEMSVDTEVQPSRMDIKGRIKSLT